MKRFSCPNYLNFKVNSRIWQQYLEEEIIYFSGNLRTAINSDLNFDTVNCKMKTNTPKTIK